MTDQEFEYLRDKIPPGSILTFSFDGLELCGTFIGCSEDAVVIEANGNGYFWPKELCSYQKLSYKTPSYS